MQTIKVTLLGTGLMGVPMSRNLLKAGFPLTVWNRTASKAAPLAADGAVVAETVQAAVAEAEVIITLLMDGPAVLSVQQQVANSLKPGAIWVDMSSTRPGDARAQRDFLSGLGVKHLDAPVSGGTKGAEAATLAIMVGGDADVLECVKPVFDALGRPVLVGGSGTGQLSKLVNQAIVPLTIGAVAEGMLLAERGGADPAQVRAANAGGFADSVILQQHGTRMSTGDYTPGGRCRSQIKDLDNVLGEARDLGLRLPMLEAIRDRYYHIVHEMDGEEWDHSSIFLELKARNGLE